LFEQPWRNKHFLIDFEELGKNRASLFGIQDTRAGRMIYTIYVVTDKSQLKKKE